MARIKIAVSKLNAVQLIIKGMVIYKKMDGNANFPSPSPSLAALQASIDALKTAINEAMGRDRTKIIIRRKREEDLRNILRQLGTYVQGVAAGDEIKIASSGFETRKKPQSKSKTEQVKNLRVKSAPVNNALKLLWKPVPRARSYQVLIKDMGFEIKDEPEKESYEASTSSRFTITGLTEGHIYRFKVRALSPSGYGPWSDVAQDRVV